MTRDAEAMVADDVLARALAEQDHDGCSDDGGDQRRRNYYHREAARLIGRLAIKGHAITRTPAAAAMPEGVKETLRLVDELISAVSREQHALYNGGPDHVQEAATERRKAKAALRAMLDAALSATPGAAVEGEWVCVPREITEEIQSLLANAPSTKGMDQSDWYQHWWSLLIAASPDSADAARDEASHDR